MHKTYDYIIWGASLKGIAKAIELKELGKKVLLLNKFGFPGGDITESLSCVFKENDIEPKGKLHLIASKLEALKHNYDKVNEDKILVYPEAVKRASWEVINEQNIKFIFHVTPVAVKECNYEIELKCLGREGYVSFYARQLIDCSDNGYLDFLLDKFKTPKSFNINLFLTEKLDYENHPFSITQKAKSDIGEYLSVSFGVIEELSLDELFNRNLNRLTLHFWEKYQSRILIMPASPELIY